MNGHGRQAATPLPGTGLLGAALAAAGRGWPVFPLLPGGKAPAIRAAHAPGDPCAGGCGRFGHGYRDATTDRDVIAGWWRRWPGGNYGIATGPAGLVVIDVDAGKGTPPPGGPGNAGVLPEQGLLPTPAGIDHGWRVLTWLARREGAPAGWSDTFTVGTPSGGLHLYYAAPTDVVVRSSVGFTAGRVTGLGWCLDVRAAGGYVVGPGSHAPRPAGPAGPAGEAAGRRGRGVRPYGYRVLQTAPVAPLPAFLTTRLTATDPAVTALLATPGQRPQPVASSRKGGRVARWWPAAVAGELAHIAAAVAGGRDGSGRNATLNRAAYKLGRRVEAAGLSDAQVDDLAHQLVAAGTATGLPEREARAAVASGLAGGRRNPQTITERTRSPGR